GKALGFPLPVAEAAYRQFAAAKAKGLGREDDAAVIKVYAEGGKVELPEEGRRPRGPGPPGDPSSAQWPFSLGRGVAEGPRAPASAAIVNPEPRSDPRSGARNRCLVPLTLRIY